jgi:hypothetical protein
MTLASAALLGPPSCRVVARKAKTEALATETVANLDNMEHYIEDIKDTWFDPKKHPSKHQIFSYLFQLFLSFALLLPSFVRLWTIFDPS